MPRQQLGPCKKRLVCPQTTTLPWTDGDSNSTIVFIMADRFVSNLEITDPTSGALGDRFTVEVFHRHRVFRCCARMDGVGRPRLATLLLQREALN